MQSVTAVRHIAPLNKPTGTLSKLPVTPGIYLAISRQVEEWASAWDRGTWVAKFGPWHIDQTYGIQLQHGIKFHKNKGTEPNWKGGLFLFFQVPFQNSLGSFIFSLHLAVGCFFLLTEQMPISTCSTKISRLKATVQWTGYLDGSCLN